MTQVSVVRRFSDGLSWSGWEARRVMRAWTRRFGLLVLIVPASVVVCAVDYYYMNAQLHLVQEANIFLRGRAGVPVAARPLADSGSDRLRAFEDLLLPQDGIPGVVEDMLQTARAEDVSIARVDYQVEADTEGEFLRYRMTLPLRGESAAIVRFMDRTLRSHRTMILESVRLTRQRTDASRIDAKVQWVLLTHLANRPRSLSPTRSQQSARTGEPE